MKTISDPAKSINIVHETEVLVVCLGPEVALAISVKVNQELQKLDISKTQRN